MKGLSHENGQPELIKENLNWATGAVQAALREHITDVFSPGFIVNSGPGHTAPCRIESIGNYYVKVNPGIAIAPLTTEPQLANSIDSLDLAETGGERIVVTAADSAAEFVPTNWNKTTFNGVANILTPISSGAYNIPVNYGATIRDTYIWISYLNTVSTTILADHIVSKVNPAITLYPVRTNGYRIETTETSASPAPGRLLVGRITCPVNVLASLANAIIVQSEQPYSKVRAGDWAESVVNYQDDSHADGIIGDASTLELEVINGTVGGFDAIARCKQVPVGSAVYVSGHRGVEVQPAYSASGVDYGYCGFSSEAAGTWFIYVRYDASSQKFIVDKSLTNPGAGYAVLGTVVWGGSLPGGTAILSPAPLGVVNMRSFGLTGTVNIQNQSVTEPKLYDNSVSTRTIVGSSVVTSKIADLNVTSGKLAAGAVIAGKILAGTIVDGDVSASAALDPSKIRVPQTNIIIGDATGKGAPQAVFGDVTISNSGETTIGSGKIKTAMVDNAQITLAKLAPDVLFAQQTSPIRWIAQGDMMTAMKVVETLSDISAHITSVHMAIGGTLPLDGDLSLDILINGVSIFFTVPKFISGAVHAGAPFGYTGGYITASTGLALNTTPIIYGGNYGTINSLKNQVQPGDRISLNITAVGTSNPGTDLLMVIRMT